MPGQHNVHLFCGVFVPGIVQIGRHVDDISGHLFAFEGTAIPHKAVAAKAVEEVAKRR